MLYYIHGYESSPDSAKGRLFRDKLGARAIKYRDCKPEDIVISDCLKRIENEIKNDKDVFLIGSSLGGFLAACIALENPNVKKLVLLNPAVIPPSEDIGKFQGVPYRILREMKNNLLFEKRIGAKIMILAGTEDDVIPLRWILEFAMKQNATVQFLCDDHGFSRNMEKLPNIIKKCIVEK